MSNCTSFFIPIKAVFPFLLFPLAKDTEVTNTADSEHLLGVPDLYQPTEAFVG